MKKIAALLFGSLSFLVFSQTVPGSFDPSKIPSPAGHYVPEYTFDTSTNPAEWDKVPAEMQTSFATTDQLFLRAEVPNVSKNKVWEATGWAGERLNTQLLLWAGKKYEQIRIHFSDLKSSDGKQISKENLNAHLVRYVVSNYPYGAKDVTCEASPYKQVYLMPDRFEKADRFDLDEKSVRPVWIALNVPSNTAKGQYTGTVEVTSTTSKSQLSVKINVQNQQLPKPSEWKHRLDLWQNPWAVAWQNNVEPWSEEHILLLKKHLKLYADAGGTFITTYGVHSPWADNSYMIEGGMIDWIKQKNGNWKFNYRIFDQYVELAMSLGINEAITVYTPVPWGFRFRVLDETTGNYRYETWEPTSKEFTNNWNAFLNDFKKHLKQKGWFEKTYIGINENPLAQTLAAIKMVKNNDSKWKITYAGDYHKELENLLDDYCYLYGKESDMNVVKNRASKGFTTTYYVYCNPPYPNNFLFSPPIEGRWLGWYTYAYGYDGFLRWAYEAWPADAMRDARHTAWAAGDSFLVYPGANSSIRFEKLREGIVDFEKLKIIAEKAGKSNNPEVKKLMTELNSHLQNFTKEKDFNSEKITSDVNKGRKLVEQLSDLL